MPSPARKITIIAERLFSYPSIHTYSHPLLKKKKSVLRKLGLKKASKFVLKKLSKPKSYLDYSY